MPINDILILIVAYLIGCIPFGVVIAKISGLGDITKQGSGNIGATNITRIGGKKLGLATFLLDALKGVFAILVAKNLGAHNPDLQIYAAALAVLGHIFPVFLKFKGGKGVATTLGVVLFFSPVVGGLTILIWIIVFVASKISSASALAAVSLMPFLALFFSNDIEDNLGNLYFKLCVFLSVVVFAKHHQNIVRLLNGTESKFTRSKK
jgi:glycerol-3-phosphate acyltransferase PlsY